MNGVKDRANSEHQFVELLKNINTKILLNNLKIIFEMFNLETAF